MLYREDKVAQKILMNLLGIVCDDKTFRKNKWERNGNHNKSKTHAIFAFIFVVIIGLQT